jgi:hypothetical protein
LISVDGRTPHHGGVRPSTNNGGEERQVPHFAQELLRAVLTFRYARRLRKKFKKEKIKQEMKAGAPTVNARTAYRGSLYRVERG